MVQKQGWTPLVFLLIVVGSLAILTMYRSDRERTNIPMTAFYATETSESSIVTNTASSDGKFLATSIFQLHVSYHSILYILDPATDAFTLSSSMFINGGDMPKQYSCTDEEGNAHTRYDEHGTLNYRWYSLATDGTP